MKTTRIITLVLALAFVFPVQTFAGVEALPEVSEEMLDPGFWTKDITDADKVLADAGEIKRLNELYLSCKDCTMNDLASMEGTFNGEAENLSRWKAALSDLSKYLDGKHYDEADNIISGKYVMDILNNLDDPDASTEQDRRYGIVVHRSDVRSYPTRLIIADDPGDSDFDNVQNSGVRVGEPVVIHGTSSDGEYFYCYTSCVSGWIPSGDIAVCKDKGEWLGAWQIPDDEVMVVTDSKITLEDSNTNPEFTGLMLTMGTVLEKVQDYEYGKMIANRSSYYNYPVWIPVRDENGMYSRKKALISVHHGLSDGYLPLTTENILEQAYTKLGDTYGWGGMLSSVDCSSYVRDIYKCFGLELPRNTTWQAAMPVEKYDLSMADDADKMELFDTLMPGTILFFKGHEMLYLGHDGEDYYVISATSSMMYPGTDDKARVRSVIINTLDEKRANGNTWLSDLYEAAVPYAANEENIVTPVFSVKEIPADGSISSNTTAEAEEPEAEKLPYEEIAFDPAWDYADSSKINDGIARLYRSDAVNRRDITICINAGHGTKGGDQVKTPCHPDGSPKIVSGSTAAGATEATAISNGCTMASGELEAAATLKAAMVTKEELLKAGYDVLMIRETGDVRLDNIARTLVANNNADAHISIHYDSTANGKGVFFCSVPDDADYKDMEPVRSYWQLHDKLGKSLIYGLTKQGFPKWDSGELEMDLTQTSFSTIPSVDLEIGDTSSDYSYKELVKVADGIREGLDMFFEKADDALLYQRIENANTVESLQSNNGSFCLRFINHGSDGETWEYSIYGDENEQVRTDPYGTLVIEGGEAYGFDTEENMPYRYLFLDNHDSFEERYNTISNMSGEKTVSRKEEDGRIILETETDSDVIKEYYSAYGYPKEDIEKIVCYYVIDKDTYEIIEHQSSVVINGQKILTTEDTTETGVKHSLDPKIKDAVFGEDTRTVKVITDAGTEQEKTYEQTVTKGGSVVIWTANDFEDKYYLDPECTKEFESDYTKDQTIYLKRIDNQ